MSNVKPDYIKVNARNIVEEFPGLFTTDFETNKIILDEKYEIYSHQIRNKIAGYIITILKTKDNNYEGVRMKSKDSVRSRKRKSKKK